MMNQKGFTLIEVLVVVGVISIVLVGIVASIYQVVWASGRSNSRVVALADLNQAALRLKKDIQMAHETSLPDGEPTQNSVNLTWTDYTGFDPEDERSHYSNYVLSGTELYRTYDGSNSTAGRHITFIEFTRHDREVSVLMSATGTGWLAQSENVSFKVYMRSEALQ